MPQSLAHLDSITGRADALPPAFDCSSRDDGLEGLVP